MAARQQSGDWSKLLIVLLLLWPLVLLFFVPNRDGAAPALLWILGIALAVLGWLLLGRAQPQGRQVPQPPSEIAAPPHFAESIDVDTAAVERRPRTLVNWILLLLTFATTTFAGAAHQGVNLLAHPERFTVGLPYSLSLMAILGCHELGHYFTARRHGMNVTPPYFIPVPFALGTFGAFIQMRTPPKNRRALFDVAVAGPLAGLVVAIPALYFGLQASQVMPSAVAHAEGAGTLPGASILLTAIASWALDQPVHAGEALRLGPMAFAGWLGLMVTALNLLPIGQLDGGPIARSMFGTRIGGMISAVSMLGLFLLALFVWPGLLMWAIIVFFMTGRPTPPLNDVSPISPARVALGIASFIILALIVTPAEVLSGGMRCPYL